MVSLKRIFQVLLGGGRRHWLPKVARDPEMKTEEGRRLDGRNLIDDWVRDKKRRNLRAEYVWNKGQFDKVNPKLTDFLLGKCVFLIINYKYYLSFSLSYKTMELFRKLISRMYMGSNS